MRSQPARIAVILVSCWFAAAAADNSKQVVVKGPVVSSVQPDRATVTWVTHKAIGELRPTIGGAPVSIGEPVYHEVQLTGLQPGTRYEYDLSAYGADARGSFVTAPGNDAASFTFAVFGDTRTRHEFHRTVALKVLAEKPDFVLHTGDLVNNGFVAADWDKYFEIERELLRAAAFFPSFGNHDRNTPLFAKYFAVPGGDPHYYSFDWGAAHFIALDTNEPGATAQERIDFQKRQLAWVREDLRRNRKTFTFVYFHHPLYSAVETRKGSAAKLAEVYEPVLLEGGVTAVFAGHDHNYQHHVVKGLHHVVTGGGGAPLYEVSPIPELTLKAVKTENYVRVRVEGGKAKFNAFDLEGKVLDSFELAGRTLSAAAR